VKWLRGGMRMRATVKAGAVPGLPMVMRTFGGITTLVVAVNIVGVIVVGLLQVALNSDATPHQRTVVGIVGAIYGLAAITFGATTGFVLQARTLRWLARERVPTHAEARRALRNPLDLATLTGALWLLGAVVMGVLAATLRARASEIIALSGGLVLAGLTTAGITYLVAVRLGRPITVLALMVYPPTEAVIFAMRARLLLIWLLATGVPLLGIVLILSSPPGHSDIIGAGLFAAVVALVVGAITFAMLARSITEPLRIMVAALQRVGQGQLDTAVPVDAVGEIGMLQRGINEMVAGLRERERIQVLFGRHVGTSVAQEAIHGGLTLGGEACDVVALFVDITGSTKLTHESDPREFIAILNRFFRIVVSAVEHNGGLVNKFEGDAALCVFGAPVVLDDPTTAALRAARAIRDEVYANGELDLGIGVASGPVIAGQIGAASRLEYTVIGDAVNEAARLTDLAKRVDGRILASGTTVEAAAPAEQQHWIRGRAVRLRGRASATRTYRCAVPAAEDIGA